MAFDEKSLAEKYATTELTIQSNTNISSRTTAVITKLSPTTTQDDTKAKAPLVILRAQSRWASKLISIAEIAKRDFRTKGIKVFQYSALSSETIEIDRKPKANPLNGAGAEGNMSDDETFQTMGAHELRDKKKRAVPILTVYLATHSVKTLRSEFGEQTST